MSNVECETELFPKKGNFGIPTANLFEARSYAVNCGCQIDYRSFERFIFTLTYLHFVFKYSYSV